MTPHTTGFIRDSTVTMALKVQVHSVLLLRSGRSPRGSTTQRGEDGQNSVEYTRTLISRPGAGTVDERHVQVLFVTEFSVVLGLRERRCTLYGQGPPASAPLGALAAAS